MSPYFIALLLLAAAGFVGTLVTLARGGRNPEPPRSHRRDDAFVAPSALLRR